MSAPAVAGGVLAMIVMMAPPTARAEEEPPHVTTPKQTDEAPAFAIGPKPAWYLLVGVMTGGTAVAHDRGGYLGRDLTLVRLGPWGRYYGFFNDSYYDFGAHRGYVTTGVELGYKFVGVDGGAVIRFGADRPEWGASTRLSAGIGIVSIYGRYAYFVEALGPDNAHVVQIGALIKVPVKVWGVE